MFIIGAVINILAPFLGTTPAAFRLLLSILFGYPIASFYRTYVAEERAKEIHHIYFLFTGLTICYLNFGEAVCHSLIAVSVTYILLTLLQFSPEFMVGTNFIFHMLYLIIGYIWNATDTYDICWTMPHCILILRLIGLSFDVADGMKSEEELSKEQTQTALKEMPSLLEIFAYAYFPLTFLIGPYISFERYARFVDGEFTYYVGSTFAGAQRLICGLFYLFVHLMGSSQLPNSYLLSPSFRKESLPIKLIIIGIWGKVVLYKYISCWLLVEGSLMHLGFTCSDKLADGTVNWYACANVQVLEFETGLGMQHYIKSFNVCTNNWVSRYVYKRLKHFENRQLSHLAAILFLAVWHGVHSGYYVTFLLEFIVVTAEREMLDYFNTVILSKFGDILVETCPVWEYCRFIILKSYDIILMGFCIVPFVFLTFEKWRQVYSEVYYCGFIFLGLWFAFYRFHKTRLNRQQQQQHSVHNFFWR